MATKEDVENGVSNSREEIRVPLIAQNGNSQPVAISEINKLEGGASTSGDSIWMVIFSTAVTVCGSFEFGFSMGYTATTQASIIADLGMSLSEFSVFGSILNFGAMLGSIMGGQIADKFGRKKAMWLSALVCIVGYLMVYFGKDTLLLNIGRFFTGYGIAIFSYAVPVFIAEITPKNLRGTFTTLNQLLICTGVSFSYVLGALVSWRTLALIGMIPCIVIFIGLFFIPESPRWMAKAGYQKEFLDALKMLRGKDADVTVEAEDIRDYVVTLEQLPKATVGDLFGKKYFRLVSIGVGLMAVQQFGGINGIVFYSNKIFESAGFPSGNFGTIVMACIQVPVTLLGAILMDRSGRRKLLFISSSGVTLGCLLSGFAFFWKARGILEGWDAILILIGVLTFIGSFSIGLGAVPWVIMSEIFPINIKGVCGSMVTLEHWVGAWALSYFFNFLASWSSAGTFFIFAGINMLGIIFIALMVPETKGKSLEEIQVALNIS